MEFGIQIAKNKLLFLIILIEKSWGYLVMKKLSSLLSEITSQHDGDFRCLNCLHSFRTENKLKSHKNVCQNKDFIWSCNVIQKDNIL